MDIIMLTSDYLPAYGGIGVYVHELISQMIETYDCNVNLLVARLKTQNDYMCLAEKQYESKVISSKLTITEFNTDFLTKLSNEENAFYKSSDEKSAFDFICHSINSIFFGEALEYIKQNNISADIIHVHDAFIGPSALWISKLLGLPLVATAHSINVQKEWMLDNYRRYLYNNCSRITCLSEKMKDEMQLRYQTMAPMDVIYNSVRTRKETKDIDKTRTSNLVYCGRLVAVKGVDLLLKAYHNVYTRHPNVYLTIIGEGDEKDKLVKLTENYGLKDVVTFTGYLPNDQVRDYFSDSLAVVLPSRKESFSTVALEAMSEGAYVIASRVGGFEEMIDHDINGMLFTSENIKELTACILSAIENDPEKIMSVKRNARKKVEDKFTWDNNIKRVMEAYVNAVREG